jgi:hypothetical protein
MKKILLLSFLLVFVLTGCVVTGEKGISFAIIDNNYKTDEANKSVKISIEIDNNLGSDLYYYDFSCYNPVSKYELIDGEWSGDDTHTTNCYGLGYAEPTPTVLKKGEKINREIGVGGSGIYKLKFKYYLTENDFQNKTNAQDIFSNQFSVESTVATLSSVKKNCEKERIGDTVNCLYVSAKNVMFDDLNLALDLCWEISDSGYGFDECFDTVALLLAREGDMTKAKNVCANYQTADRILVCEENYNKFK